MNRSFENIVIQNKINELKNQLKFALTVLGIPCDLTNSNYMEYIEKMLKLEDWQFNLLKEKTNNINRLKDMLHE